MEVTYAGADSVRPPLEVVAREFVAVKSYKAKGKRLTTYAIDSVTELEPLEDPEIGEEFEEESDENTTRENATEEFIEKSDDEIRDELTGQTRLFE